MKFDTKEFSRRTFIKGSLAAGAALGLGTALDLSGSPFQAAKAKGESKIVHSACPRNCYDTCSILSTVEDGVLKRVEGDKANTYTRGRLCAKGFSYTRSVYSPDRIKYPMRQSKRGGGRWERISWPDAFDIIAKKILAIKKEYGNTLAICLNKYSGNFYVNYLHTVEGEKNMPDYSVTKSLKVIWTHRQDPKASVNSSLSASVNFASESFEKKNLSSLYDPLTYSQSTRTSSVSYSYTWPSIGLTLNSSVNLSQNMRDSTIALTLPSLNLTLARFYPFKRKKLRGKENWYEKISMSYTGQLSNSINKKVNAPRRECTYGPNGLCRLSRGLSNYDCNISNCALSVKGAL